MPPDPPRSPDAVPLPGGAWVRARSLRRAPAAPPAVGLYLGTARTRRRYDAQLRWPHRWLRWPDFWLPTDGAAAARAVVDLHRRVLAGEDVEVACPGGVGRTGTVLACLAVLDGLPADAAVAWVRAHHHRRAVETPWQRGWVSRFQRWAAASPGPGSGP